MQSFNRHRNRLFIGLSRWLLQFNQVAFDNFRIQRLRESSGDSTLMRGATHGSVRWNKQLEVPRANIKLEHSL